MWKYRSLVNWHKAGTNYEVFVDLWAPAHFGLAVDVDLAARMFEVRTLWLTIMVGW